jgi:uncharacterized membrane protein
LGVVEQLVEAGTRFAPLGAADASVTVLLEDLPAAALSNLVQLAKLVFDGLLVGRMSLDGTTRTLEDV